MQCRRPRRFRKIYKCIVIMPVVECPDRRTGCIETTLLRRTKQDAKQFYSMILSDEKNQLTDGIKTVIASSANCSPEDINLLSFFTVWFPYQTRCAYFHANKPMPLIISKADPILKMLQVNNVFVQSFLENNLPTILDNNFPNNQQIKTLQSIDIERIKGKGK